MRNVKRALVLAGVLGVGVGVGFAQISIEPPGGGGGAPQAQPATSPGADARPTAPARAPSGSDATTQPTAEDVLENLLKQQASERPGGTAGGAATQKSAKSATAGNLLREGELIEMRTGRLKPETPAAPAAQLAEKPAEHGPSPATPAAVSARWAGTGMMVVFDHRDGEPDYPPMEVVPSRRLALMEDASDRGTRAVSFRITAEVTEYRGKNYLYIKPSGGGPIGGSPAAGATPTTQRAAQTQTATAPALAQQVEPAAPDVPVGTRLREEDTVEGHVGRLVRDTKTGLEVIVFDADGREMTDPPMGVIPCKSLQVMEDATDGGNKPLKFRISGEVTQYRDRNYLYIRAFQVIKDLGQGLGG